MKTKKGGMLLNLALDRIIEFQELPNEPFVAHDGIDFERYYSDLIGVTKSSNDRPHKVLLEFDAGNVPYVITKPLHHTQQLVAEKEKTSIFRIDVILNYELEREILGFGECVKVLGPRALAQRIKRRLKGAHSLYANEEKEKEQLQQKWKLEL